MKWKMVHQSKGYRVYLTRKGLSIQVHEARQAIKHQLKILRQTGLMAISCVVILILSLILGEHLSDAPNYIFALPPFIFSIITLFLFGLSKARFDHACSEHMQLMYYEDKFNEGK